MFSASADIITLMFTVSAVVIFFMFSFWLKLPFSCFVPANSPLLCSSQFTTFVFQPIHRFCVPTNSPLLCFVSAEITILIDDVNDEEPFFCISEDDEFTAMENTTVDSSYSYVGEVCANDLDEADQGSLTYSLV